jgi:hypothetical protein
MLNLFCGMITTQCAKLDHKNEKKKSTAQLILVQC